jgi:hypothetical protein
MTRITLIYYKTRNSYSDSIRNNKDEHLIIENNLMNFDIFNFLNK